MRIRPYPPSLRRIAAKTIEPAIGASTCALGNHKWTENIGNFTKNPAIVSNQKIVLVCIYKGYIKCIDIERSLWLEE